MRPVRLRPVLFACAILLAGAPPAAAITVVVNVTATNNGTVPSTFSVGPSSLTFPPVPAPTIVSITLSGTLSDLDQGAVSLTPSLPDGDSDGIAEIVSLSVGLGSPSIHVADIGPASNVAGAYGPFSEGPFTGLGAIDTLSFAWNFTLAGRDAADLTLTLTINELTAAVPWVPGLWLLGGGVGVLTLAAWRRR